MVIVAWPEHNLDVRGVSGSEEVVAVEDVEDVVVVVDGEETFGVSFLQDVISPIIRLVNTRVSMCLFI
jgi:hypothetical protein